MGVFHPQPQSIYVGNQRQQHLDIKGGHYDF